jgi:pyruvate/2-oxoglutarate dehydrogenase complex dihydrolipoamide dehydrogenase (E3) component/pimeloyl-ACP methyl ester carboxylesterase
LLQFDFPVKDDAGGIAGYEVRLLFNGRGCLEIDRYQNVIIGSGEGGKYLAWHLAESGQHTVVIERRWIGGSCPNINCLPAKNEIWSAKVANLVRHGAEFGAITGPVSIDMEAVRRRKREMVDGLVAIHVKKYKETGAELVMGHARFTGPKTFEVNLNDGGSRTITGERIFLNLGTHAAIPSTPGLRESEPMTNIDILELDRLPEHLIVIGGGYVGLEFAQAFRRFGSRVTILQRAAHLLGNEDPDISGELERILVAEGIQVLTRAELVKVTGRSGSEVSAVVRTPEGERVITGTDILVATGRVPNTVGIGLEVAGVQVTPGGWLRVNERLETTAPGVWAIGECAGSPQFTHASMDDFRVIRDNLAGGDRKTTDRPMPSCLYTDPQVAHVGLTEREAQEQRIAVKVARLPMASVLRTRTISETQGFMKALISPDSGRILGFTMVGAEAGEVMTVVQMAMQAGFPYTVLRDSVLSHPTMAEGLNVLFSTVKPATVAVIQKKVENATKETASWPETSIRRVEADGVTVFYREAGPADAPVVLLLHGFPTSSFQYRELIPRLADRYRVIAPDLPGFGFTEVPEQRQYVYSFDALAQTIEKFTDALGLKRYALYVFDYGAPTGFRLAMAHPEQVTAIVSQNGNAYEEGLGDAWAPIRRYWNDPTSENRESIRTVLNTEGMRREYASGIAEPAKIAPEGYTLDGALMARPGNQDIQLDLFLDYANNVKLYPAFQEYFRTSKPRLLAIWGKNDPYFIPAGAEAFRRDNPNAVVEFLDTGHFALETHVNVIATAMRGFLAKAPR